METVTTLDSRLIEAIEQTIWEYMAAESVPGAAVAVVQDGEMVYASGFGLADLVARTPITSDTVFGIGSVGKSLTAVAVMQLVEEGRLPLDTPVVEVIPELRLPDMEMARAITVWHLLSHSSGLPLLPVLEIALGWIEHPCRVDTLDDLLDYLATMSERPAGWPGERFSYSNDGYALAGTVIERASGMSYARYIKERVFLPLSMTRSTLADPTMLGLDDIASLYDYDESSMHPDPVYRPAWPSSPLIAPAGLHRSTVTDMARYLIAHLEGLPGVSEDGLELLHQPWIDRDSTSSYALGWGVVPDYRGELVLAHSGGITGVSSHVILLPERRTGVVALLNVSGGPSREIAEVVMERVLGLPEADPVDPYVPSGEEMERAAGTYLFGRRSVTVALDGPSLTIQVGSKPPAVMQPLGPNEYRAALDRRVVPIAFPVGDGEGRAGLMSLMGRVCWRVE